MNGNSKGVFPWAQVAAQVMVKQANCVIVSMASERGMEGSEGQSVYAASKNAVNSLNRSWAKELGKKRAKRKSLETVEFQGFSLVRGTGLEPTKRRFDLPLSVPISTITWESNANFLPSHVGKFYLISTQ